MLQARFRRPLQRRVLRTGQMAWLLLALAANALPSAQKVGAADPSPGEHADRLEAAFADLEQREISVIVALVHGDEQPVVREFGALREDGIPPGETQVDIGSITKTVTGAMLLKLAEQGKVQFDETLADIFSEVPADKAGITVQQLLTHSSGFRDAVGSDEERLAKNKFLERAFWSRLISEPGDEYHYSNVGFSVLAAIIEHRSGKTYDTFLQEDVLAGLGFENTGYMSIYEDDRSLHSRDGETIIQASWGGHEPYWNLIGNGGLVSTPAEYMRFRQAFASGKIVAPEFVERAQTPHVPENEAKTSYYGYGLVVQDHPRLGRFYWHDGGNGIFSAQWMDFAAQNDLIFTAAANGEEGDAFSAIGIVYKHLYPRDDD